ncbi:copper radical oxidase-like protein [Phlebopus sp. FC_14]|nr:copper radical oxidase-like protein [Phlebopus sp. FC_14]
MVFGFRSPAAAATLLSTYGFPPPVPTNAKPRGLSGDWMAFGCWTDNVGSRTLASAFYSDATAMTVESCIGFCSTRTNSFIYAGVEYAGECYCGNVLSAGASNVTLSNCNMPCTGNSSEFCGAGSLLNVYWSGGQAPPGAITVPTVGNWTSLGCYNDTIGARALAYGVAVSGGVSAETCTTACYNAGYPFAGMEYADECYCGSTIDHNAGPTLITDCDMTCAGDSTEFCGGPNRLNYTGTLPSTPTEGAGETSGGTGSVSPVTSGLPETWTYAACYIDNAYGRVLGNEYDSSTTTIESCISHCSSANFTTAGIEYSTQCFCGDYLINGATLASESDCNMACGGNATEACGGPNRISVYTSASNVTVLPVPTTQKTSLSGQWQYQGCLAEPSGGVRIFPYELDWTTNNTIDGCLNQCAAFGYPAAGLEYGEQCFCGDIADVEANGGTYVSDSDCNMPCSGDPIHLCGGGNRLSTYYWNGSMNVWNTLDNIGYYEASAKLQFLIGGLVVPLIATVGINDKVTFLEKYGTSVYNNSTGAYELDLSLTDNYLLAWREMHVKTDVFCSGSIILPDKGGRQINVGGWSLESTFGVRLYTPDGSPGVNGTNDWEENVDELSLQRGRWYPTAMMMPNGSILVVGGETGSNAYPQPSLEILPKPSGGDTVITLDYLQRTDPNNLYPFLMVLPSGRFFIGYYNEARILDPVTFDTIAILPNMPGAVNNFLAGRTYPMEGSAVLLPQYAPYMDPIEILICGGSTPGAAIALDNCISIAPEVENATWTLERMPSKRVMPCMVTLPDGTYMILNGAHQGVAGFGLASDPNLGAVLYDPSKPVGQRMSILNTTIVARLYHSEATLLPDGRVLVSGSDPQTYYPNGSYVYPEEMRVEVYLPPYLSQGFRQPEFTISQTDWDLGGQYEIEVNLFQGTTDTMRVSLVAASSSTHGNVMSGGRIIFPQFSCTDSACTIVAPPNAYVCPPGWHQLFILDGPTPSHSAWVRIGGDPAQLGNWPDYPDFVTPGV